MLNDYPLVAAAEIRDHETSLVSGPFSWFQSRQKFHETHETEANSLLLYLSIFLYVPMLDTRFGIFPLMRIYVLDL